MLLEQMDPGLSDGEKVWNWLAAKYTEDVADAINHAIVNRIPDLDVKLWIIPIRTTWVRAVALKALDRMTPELLLTGLWEGMQKVGLVPSDRRMAWPGS